MMGVSEVCFLAKFFLLVCVFQSSTHVACSQSPGSSYTCILVVNSTSPSARENCSCPSERNATAVVPVVCVDLSSALGALTNSTQVIIEEPRHQTLSKDRPPPVVFHGLHDISLEAGGSLNVSVTCAQGIGLSFTYTSGVSIRGLEFQNCGAVHDSTSRNWTIFDHVQFYKFKAALYFEFCQNVSLSHVTVTNSDGIGLVLFSTVGKNTFEYCDFSYNSVQEKHYPGGGGVYIEFPYCPPGKPEACNGTQTIPSVYRSNAQYSFNHSSFRNNVANSSHPVEYQVNYPPDKNHQGLGKGGGICIYLCSADNISIAIENSNISGNRAVWGGGALVEFLSDARNNTFVMTSTFIENNDACFCQNFANQSLQTGGGGVRVGFAYLKESDSHNNSIQFNSCHFIHNRAFWGGGLSFVTSREPDRIRPTNTLEFFDCEWLNNLGRTGSAIDMYVYYFSTSGAISEVNFTNCHFCENTDRLGTDIGTPISKGTVYTEAIPLNFIDSVTFDSNNRSAIVAVNTALDFFDYCNATFKNNEGKNGGGIDVVGHSFIRVHNHTNMVFINNSAAQYGGGIHANQVSDTSVNAIGNCFIQYNEFSANVSPENWTAHFYFENNTATYTPKDREKMSIAAVSILSCTFVTTNSSYYENPSFAYNRSKVITFCQDNWIYAGFGNSSCHNEIATAPATYDKDSYSITAVPGNSTEMKIIMSDDTGNSKFGTDQAVFTAWSYNKTYRVGSTYNSGDRITVYGKPGKNILIGLATLEPRRLYTELTVELEECPLGLMQVNTSKGIECTCDGTFGGAVHCHDQENQVYLERGWWIGKYNGTTVVALSPYTATATHNESIYLDKTVSEVEEQLCKKSNRMGMLCGKCKEGFGISATSINSNPFKCVNCTDKTTGKWAYPLSQYCSATLFFLGVWLLCFLKLGAARGPANAFIFFAQVVTTTFDIDGDNTIHLRNVSFVEIRHAYTTLYEVWNLDFFRGLLPEWCIGEDINAYGVFLVQYAMAAYPLVIIIILVLVSCLVKSFVIQMVSSDTRERFRKVLFDFFATLIILSYSKFALITAYMLTPVGLYAHDGTRIERVMYYNGTIVFLSNEHMPYFVVVIIVLVLLLILPPMILLLYPSWISITPRNSQGQQRSYCTCKLSCNARKIFPRPSTPATQTNYVELLDQSEQQPPQAVDAPDNDYKNFFELLLESFQKCYKDGSEPGQRDCRYFAGIYLLFRPFLFFVFSYTGEWFHQYCIQQLVCMIGILFFTMLRPYRSSHYNNLDAIIFGILSVINSFSIYNIYETTLNLEPSHGFFVVQVFLIFLPLVYILGHVCWFVGKKLWKREKTRKIIEACGKPVVKVLCFLCLKYRKKYNSVPNNYHNPGYSSTIDSSFSQFMSDTEGRQLLGQQRYEGDRNQNEDENEDSGHEVTPPSLLLREREGNAALLREPSSSQGRGTGASGYGTMYSVVGIDEDGDDKALKTEEKHYQTGQAD